ncbi:uncharacterized protein [Palaemon carinicauda]|uniref:uncharacterized protein n=1 Tax=Palaemon carinicauda TaxID=392227 RepID=UPI0035B5D00A
MVDKLTPHLQKQSTYFREPLHVGLKLAVTLRFLATGNSYQSQQYSFRAEASTICKFIPEVCKAVIAVYKTNIVLTAVADASYKFPSVDIGAEGGASDGGTWSNCSLHDTVEDNRAGVPQPEPLPNDGQPVPYHFVGDDAFALRTWMMKPFSHRSQILRERIYSYRLSRARRVMENAFEILCQRFRCFFTTMQQNPDTINLITMCNRGK